MEFSDDAKAILLLTGALGHSNYSEEKTLTIAQWNRLKNWLGQIEKSPQDLFHDQKIIQQWVPKHRLNPSVEKIQCLLERGFALAEASLRWHQAGIWVMTYLDVDYPNRLKLRLSDKIPPLLFGIGNKKLLRSGGLAVVGSRKAPLEELEYTKELGSAAARQGCVVVSGGAQGVDMTAMNACLENGGHAVGVLSDKLMRRSMDSSSRFYLQKEQLILISQTAPEIKLNRYEFTAAAMERNKYIYCLSDAAVVVHYGKKGGTISGAIENLNQSWVPLWVKSILGSPLKQKNEIENANLLNNKERQQLQQMQSALRLSENHSAEEHLQSILENNHSEIEAETQQTGIDIEKIRLAVVLLTIRFENDSIDQLDPLNLQEWEILTKSLIKKQLTPAHLLNDSIDELLKDWDCQSIGLIRINKLVDKPRRNLLIQEVENWKREHIRVFIRGDLEYPKALKTKLRHDSPPVIFLLGNPNLITSDSRKIMVLGSAIKNHETDRVYAQSLGESLANNDCLLVSTLKTQIEKIVFESVLDKGGSCIVVLSGYPKKVLIQSLFKKYLESGKVSIISTLPPRSLGYSSNEDNRYDIAICLSSDALILCSGKRDVVARVKERCINSQWTPLYWRLKEKHGQDNALIVDNHHEHQLHGENAENHLQRILNG
ncbi:MAG: DNA-processing protein DprA [Flavobacteriaceae bacterium]|nr:DNA-processing protein DprA [Flavobacteriaceae bacterium]